MRIIDINGRTPPWYTDGVAIFITKDCGADERKVLIKHESAHIYLQHRRREHELKLRLNKDIDKRVANIAMDMEIALHIYTDEDEQVINQPRWVLNWGITKADAPEWLLYREEIYLHLLENGTDKQSHDWDSNTDEREDSDNNTDKRERSEDSDSDTDNWEEEIEREEIIQQAKKEIEKEINNEEKRKSIIKAQEKANTVKIKPTIGSEIDAVIGKNQRVRSYKRPSRRQPDQNILKRGLVSKTKKQKVMIYLDRSWSFDDAKTRAAEEKLKYLLLKYRGKVEGEVLYFSDDVGQKIRTGGGTNYTAVIDDINYRKAMLSVIITDDDGCDSSLKTEEKVIVIPIGTDKTNIAKTIWCKEIQVT